MSRIMNGFVKRYDDFASIVPTCCSFIDFDDLRVWVRNGKHL